MLENDKPWPGEQLKGAVIDKGMFGQRLRQSFQVCPNTTKVPPRVFLYKAKQQLQNVLLLFKMEGITSLD